MSERATTLTATATDADRVFDLLDEFTQAIFADPSLLNDVPNGATLVLLPDDDPGFVERSIARGVEAIRQGRNVYFRHVGAEGRAGPDMT